MTLRLLALALIAAIPAFADGEAAPVTSLQITISKAGLQADYPALKLDVTFKNVGETTITVIRPQDGSWFGWLEPNYGLSLAAADSKPLGLPGRCGNHGATYNAKTMVTIEPGKQLTWTLNPPYFNLAPGTYTLSLSYAVAKGRYPGASYAQPAMEPYTFGPWPKGVFTGSVTSNTLSWTLPANAK